MNYNIAQINVALFRKPADHPDNADFVARLDPVNNSADDAEGFVWRLKGEVGNNTLDVHAFEDPQMLVNLTVWRDLDSLAKFVYRDPGHRAVMSKRKNWFEHVELTAAIWWIEHGKIPTIEEGKARLDHLRKHGPSPYAFTFRRPFPAPGEAEISPVLDRCA